MSESFQGSYSAFAGMRRLATGGLSEVAIAVKRAQDGGSGDTLLIFDDATGQVVDIDLRGSEHDVVGRLRPAGVPSEGTSPAISTVADKARRPGRPRLGVVAREVTLLPRHWDWLNAQAGGASVALRKLVEAARSGGEERDRARKARDAAYYFMSNLGGDLPGFEEAARCLFANDQAAFRDRIANWPTDVRDHAIRLAFGGGALAASN